MIDAVTTYVKDYSGMEWSLLKGEIQLSKTYNTQRGYEYFDWYNLRFIYKPQFQSLTIKNSLHKFYNSAISELRIDNCNYNTFTKEQVKDTVYFLCKIVGRKPGDFKLQGSFEYGINIPLSPLDPMYIIDSYVSVGRLCSEFKAVESFYGGKVLMKNAILTDYRIKLYDKSKQAQLHKKGILRYEICNKHSKRLKRLLQVKSLTFNQLLEDQTYTILTTDLLEKYDDIKKLPLNTGQLSHREFTDVYTTYHPVMRKVLQSNLTDHQKKKERKRISELIERDVNCKESIHYDIRQKLLTELSKITKTHL